MCARVSMYVWASECEWRRVRASVCVVGRNLGRTEDYYLYEQAMSSESFYFTDSPLFLFHVQLETGLPPGAREGGLP